MCQRSLKTTQPTLNLGCDPEIFFEQDGKIIGAEKVIGESLSAHKFGLTSPSKDVKKNAIVLDGVQAEFNPDPTHCREILGGSLAMSFRSLRDHLKTLKDITICMRSVVKVSKAELDTLSARAKVLGCAPSKNVHDMTASIKVNPETYKKRSAGGHIHLGVGVFIRDRSEDLVKVMDILVGNTSVLLDRDPGAAERRKVYGRAGEHRLPAHGVEYRTLSNFWLKAFPLMSLVMGLARTSVSVIAAEATYEGYKKVPNITPEQLNHPSAGWEAAKELFGMVDMADVTKAINTNDFELALKNYHKIKPFLNDHGVNNGGLYKANLEGFELFVRKIYEEGLDYWFPQDTMEHWCNMPDVPRGFGAEDFLLKVQNMKEDARGIATFKTPVVTATAGI